MNTHTHTHTHTNVQIHTHTHTHTHKTYSLHIVKCLLVKEKGLFQGYSRN